MNANDEYAMEIADRDDGQHGAELHGQQAAEQHAGSRQTWPIGQNPPALVAGTPRASATEHSPVANSLTGPPGPTAALGGLWSPWISSRVRV